MMTMVSFTPFRGTHADPQQQQQLFHTRIEKFVQARYCHKSNRC